jgi:Protein of unknown function (DUF2975)
VEPPHPTRLATAGYLTTTVLLLLTILWAAAVIGSAVAGAASGTYTPSLEITTWPGQLAEPLPPGFDLVEHVPIQVTLRHPTPAQLLLSVAVGLLPLLLVAAVLWLLRGLARSVRHGDPFSAANVRRLRRLGLLFLLGYPVMVLVTRLLQDWLVTTLPVLPLGGIGTTLDVISPIALLAGLVMFLLAEVFAHGLRLREDVEGTI